MQTLNGAILPSCVESSGTETFGTDTASFAVSKRVTAEWVRLFGVTYEAKKDVFEITFRISITGFISRIQIYVDEGPKGTTGFNVIRFCWSSARSAALSPCEGHVNGCGTLQGQWRSDPRNATAGSGRVPVLRVGLPSLAISDYVFLANFPASGRR